MSVSVLSKVIRYCVLSRLASLSVDVLLYINLLELFLRLLSSPKNICLGDLYLGCSDLI
jgi:hypothetical protein